MYATNNRSPADVEVIEVLTAISSVSARLARKLSILAAQSQFEEGGQGNDKRGTYRRDPRHQECHALR